MTAYSKDIERLTMKNDDFRRVLYTTKASQLVMMMLKPGEQIGMEAHPSDQFFRIEQGSGEADLDGVRSVVKKGFGVVVPGGVKHNVVNNGSVPLKLYTIYSPPNHKDGTVHHTPADAAAAHEQFDGQVSA